MVAAPEDPIRRAGESERRWGGVDCGCGHGEWVRKLLLSRPAYLPLTTCEMNERNRSPFAFFSTSHDYADTIPSVWPIDLACSLPRYPNTDVQIHGLDISAAQFAHPSSLPDNVTLATLDIFSPVPTARREKYHVVHIRYFCLLATNDNVPIILKHAREMLSTWTLSSCPLFLCLGAVSKRREDKGLSSTTYRHQILE